MNDWEKVAFHVFGVNLTQKNWGLIALKNIAFTALKLIALLAACVVVAFFFGQGWALLFVLLAFVYFVYKSQSA